MHGWHTGGPGFESWRPPKDIFAIFHQKWREIQSEYVEFGPRGIPMVKIKMASVQETCPRLYYYFLFEQVARIGNFLFEKLRSKRTKGTSKRGNFSGKRVIGSSSPS